MNKTEFRKKIATINQEITEEYSYEEMVEQLKNDESFNKALEYVTTKRL